MKCAKHSKEVEPVTACFLSYIHKYKAVGRDGAFNTRVLLTPPHTGAVFTGTLLVPPRGASAQFQFLSVCSVRP